MLPLFLYSFLELLIIIVILCFNLYQNIIGFNIEKWGIGLKENKMEIKKKYITMIKYKKYVKICSAHAASYPCYDAN